MSFGSLLPTVAVFAGVQEQGRASLKALCSDMPAFNFELSGVSLTLVASAAWPTARSLRLSCDENSFPVRAGCASGFLHRAGRVHGVSLISAAT